MAIGTRKGFLIDMDGVIYRGSELIPGADRFIDSLLRCRIPFLFLTNNSQRTRRDVAMKLVRIRKNSNLGLQHQAWRYCEVDRHHKLTTPPRRCVAETASVVT